MDERDIMVSDYRVMALSDDGQLVFDWVDQDQRTVKFLPDESDHTNVSNEVEEILSMKGISVVEDGDYTGNVKDGGEEFAEPVKEESGAENISDPFEPTESSQESKEVERNASKEEKAKTEQSISFIVRMDNPQDRREALNKIDQSLFQQAIDDIELSGPFKMTYRVTEQGAGLVSVEDLGTGHDVSDI